MPLTVQAYGHSDVGRKRKVNEDSFAIDEARGIYIVADGMGGHGNGATASQTAVSVAREQLNANIVKFDQYRDDPSEPNRVAATAAVEQAIQAACERIFRIGQQDSAKRGMGTTIDVVVRVGDRAILGHVGDGRVYLVRNGQGYRLTKDHTIVAQQVEAGILTPAEAEQSTLRGVLTRAVGTHASVQVDTLVLDLAAGDLLLMCSDGVTRYLRDEEVGTRLREASAGTARQIIDWANTSGGEDNSSVIVVGCRPLEVAAAAPAPDQRKVSSRIDAVRGLPLFQHLSYKEQVAILSIAHSRIYDPGAEIVKQGDPGQEMFIIVDGEVVVERDGVTIAELGAGGHFGEMSIVDDAPRSASVRAKKRTDVLTIGQSEIGGLMRLDSVLAVKILWTLVQALSGRLRVASAELIEFKLETPRRESNVQMPFAR
jgi:serine/threonine protein phosphatase PrpC